MFFKRKQGGNAATLERPETPTPIVDDFAGTDEQLKAEIARLAAEESAKPDRRTERRLLALRHIAGIRAVDAEHAAPEFPEPEYDKLPPEGMLPEFPAAEITPALVRGAILRDGFIIVRGLVDRKVALEFGQEIDRSFEEREKVLTGQPATPGYYEEIQPGLEKYAEPMSVRPWIREGGGVLAVDSPILAAQMIEMFKRAKLLDLVEGYLGEQPLISLQKTTLRKAEPFVAGAWHQDGSFMGQVRALNLWLALSRCGDVAPSLDIVPRRLDHLVTQRTEEAVLEIQVSQAMAEEAADGRKIVRPTFDPGDAMLFDDMFLHQTGSDPSMPNPRYAIENWFFGASAFPVEYGPVALH